MVRPPPHVPDHRLVAPFISVLAHKGLIKSFYRLRTLSRREVFLPAHPPADDLFVRGAGFRLEGPSVHRLLPFPLQPVSQGAFVHPETGGCFPYALMLYQIFRAHDVMLLHLRHGWPLQSRVFWNRDTTSAYRVRESGCPLSTILWLSATLQLRLFPGFRSPVLFDDSKSETFTD